MEQGQFGMFNMLPKIRASVDFIEKKAGRQALITSFDCLKDGIKKKNGTWIG